MTQPEVLPVFIGHDVREQIAYEVCRYSMARRSTKPLYHVALKEQALRYIGMMDRPVWREGVQRIDGRDGKPYSTDFSFTRFLVPALCQYDGWALFCDCDFLFLADVAELFDLADDSCAAMVVKHDHAPGESVKMDGVQQTVYRRKNWSSLILWNCGHPSNKRLTVEAVNTRSGSWLHGFDWLADDEIGTLPVGWNWLSGVTTEATPPKAVHYTLGGPWFPDCRDVPRGDQWITEREHMVRMPA